MFFIHYMIIYSFGLSNFINFITLVMLELDDELIHLHSPNYTLTGQFHGSAADCRDS